MDEKEITEKLSKFNEIDFDALFEKIDNIAKRLDAASGDIEKLKDIKIDDGAEYKDTTDIKEDIEDVIKRIPEIDEFDLTM